MKEGLVRDPVVREIIPKIANVPSEGTARFVSVADSWKEKC